MKQGQIVICVCVGFCLMIGGCTRTELATHGTYPTVQPSPGRIVFTSSRDNGIATVYVVNSDGTGLTRLTPPEMYVNSPVWVPGCHQVIFSARDGIYRIDADGSGLEHLRLLSFFSVLALSPDSGHIVFDAQDATSRVYNVWVMSADGADAEQLTDCAFNCLAPEWSPDGQAVYYWAAENDYITPPIRWSLNKIDLLNNQHEVVLSATEMADIASLGPISPDGTRFVLAREVDQEERTDIFTLDIASKTWHRLTDDQAYYDEPNWSPDGRQIVFMRYEVPSQPMSRSFPSIAGLWIMDVEGTGQLEIVPPIGVNGSPDWCVP